MKQLLNNLAFLWCCLHGQTFSMVSATANFYFYPSCMRKPLSALPEKPLSADEKQQWIPLLGTAQDYTNLVKGVTYRSRDGSILSNWNGLPIEIDLWN